jgi:hypothetical protein
LALVISLHGCSNATNDDAAANATNDDAAAVVVESAEPQMQAYFSAQKVSDMTTAFRNELQNDIDLDSDFFRFTKETTITTPLNGDVTWGLTFGLDKCEGQKSAVIVEIHGALTDSKLYLEKDANKNVKASFELDIKGGTFTCRGDARVYISEIRPVFPGIDASIKLEKSVTIPTISVSVTASLVLGTGNNAGKRCLQYYSSIAVKSVEGEKEWKAGLRLGLESELKIPDIVKNFVDDLRDPLRDVPLGKIYTRVSDEFVQDVGTVMNSLDACIDP